MHMVSVLLSEMVRPNVLKTSTKTAIIRPSPRGVRDTMHASSAYSIPQIARRTHSSAVSGPTFDGCYCRWIRSASVPASLMNLSSTTRSIAAKKYQPGSHRISHPPSFCGACLYFSREKGSAVPFPRRPLSRILCTNDLIVLHLLGFFLFSFLVRKNPSYRDSNSRPYVSEGYEVTN